MFGIGAGEFVLILIAGLILFGPSKLPELGRAIGKALKEFRKAQAALSATLEETANTPEKKSVEKNSVNESEKKSAMTVDDVINLAKKNPISEENLNEKNSNGVINNSAVADSSAGNDITGGNSDSIKKQSELAKN